MFLKRILDTRHDDLREEEQKIDMETLEDAIVTYRKVDNHEMIYLPPNAVQIYNFPHVPHLILQLKYANTHCFESNDCSSVPSMVLGYFYTLSCWGRLNDLVNYLDNADDAAADTFFEILFEAMTHAISKIPSTSVSLPLFSPESLKFLQSASFFSLPIHNLIFPMEDRKEIIAQCRHSILKMKDVGTLPLIISRDVVEITMCVGGIFSMYAPLSPIILTPTGEDESDDGEPDEQPTFGPVIVVTPSTVPMNKKCMGPCKRAVPTFAPY
ncbi:MAG: hypothetical protein V3R93_05500 [Candidatus Hydrothermarchaeaceae archaeon]